MTLEQENDLLKAQLIQCTTAMREVGNELKKERNGSVDLWQLSLVSKLDVARATPVVVQPKTPSFDLYQEETRRTASTADDKNTRVAVLALGLCGEAGEVSELIKKFVGHGVPFELAKLKKELRDVLWYLARLADEHGIKLSEVAVANVEKLHARYPDGFVQGGGVR